MQDAATTASPYVKSALTTAQDVAAPALRAVEPSVKVLLSSIPYLLQPVLESCPRLERPACHYQDSAVLQSCLEATKDDLHGSHACVIHASCASLTAHASDSSVVPCSVSLLIMCQQSRPCYRGVQASFGEAQRFLTAQGINPPVLADKAGKAGSAAEGVFNQAKPSLTSSLTSLTSRDPTTLAEYALGALAFYYLVSLSRLLWFCPAYSCLTSQLSDLLNRVCHMRCLSLPSQPCSHITLQSVIHVSDL